VAGNPARSRSSLAGVARAQHVPGGNRLAVIVDRGINAAGVVGDTSIVATLAQADLRWRTCPNACRRRACYDQAVVGSDPDFVVVARR